jgi:diaminopimelate decarboxylase
MESYEMKKLYERPVITKHYSGFMNKFGSAPVSQYKPDIEGLQVKDLAEKFGSPLFVISEKKIRENQRKAYRIFSTRYPKVQFAWSYKTNYIQAVCNVFHQENSWAEVVSEFEYDKAIKAGINGKNIIFNGPDKSKNALIKAIKNKSKIHIDHFDELYLIIEIVNELNIKADVAIRVNMDTGIYPKWDRFGFNYENGEALEALRRIIRIKNLNLIGLHTHIGTYIMNTDAYKIAVTKLVDLTNYLRTEHGILLDYIDVGGGLPSNNTLKGQYLPAEEILPSLEQYADAITSPLYTMKLSNDEMPMLILESGRALIDDAGYLITTVLANKRLSDGRRAIIIDAGVNILFTAFWYKHKIIPAQPTSQFTENSSIYGPLCMNIDCIREEILFPSVKVGDNLVIYNVGAYNMTQWMQFITYRPTVVMIKQSGEVEVIRKSESINTIDDLEIIPTELKLN